ncbi:MAG: hypothetical protein KIT31_30065 [Deltaproteobacteria bacterium]|nr:hypothetical protein [Deltaproteobacteria bacterium]
MTVDAIVLVDETADERVAGLSLRERALRVAKKAGAARIVVVELGGDRSRLEDLEGTRALLVLRADQLVHPPLVMPLLEKGLDGLAISVGDDGAYAGAMLARGDAAARVLAQLGEGRSDAAIAAAEVRRRSATARSRATPRAPPRSGAPRSGTCTRSSTSRRTTRSRATCSGRSRSGSRGCSYGRRSRRTS